MRLPRITAQRAGTFSRSTTLTASESSSCGEVRPNQHNVMVGVHGGDHLGRGRAQCARSRDVLKPRGLLGGPVAAGPEALRGAWGAAIQVAPENDGAGGGATCEERPELGALGPVCSYLVVPGGGEVSGAHLYV